MRSEGRIYVTSNGTLRIKHFLDEAEGIALDDIWTDIYAVNSQAEERVDYATQKPEELIERVLKASSNDGMTIADFFGGSGVTAAVANKLGRRFIHADIGLNSIQTTRDRLVSDGSEFDVLEIKDGVQLYRNPVQTMDKIKSLIQGLKNEDCNSVQREHDKKLNNGLPILHMIPPYRDYGRYFCIQAGKGGTIRPGLIKYQAHFLYPKQEVLCTWQMIRT